jgi:hypothetical protein
MAQITTDFSFLGIQHFTEEEMERTVRDTNTIERKIDELKQTITHRRSWNNVLTILRPQSYTYRAIVLQDGTVSVEQFFLNDDLIASLFATKLLFENMTNYVFVEETTLSRRQKAILQHHIVDITHSIRDERFNVPEVNSVLSILQRHVVELRTMLPLENEPDDLVAVYALYSFIKGTITAHSPQIRQDIEERALASRFDSGVD